MDIHHAAERGKADAVREILERDPQAVHAQLKDAPDQPLHLAAWQGRKKVAELLIAAGADVNARGEAGRTPLHYAIEHRHQSIVKLLVKAGADLGIQDDLRRTVLHIAAASEDDAMTKLLLANGAPVDLESSVYVDGPDEVVATLEKDHSRLEKLDHPEDLLLDAICVGSARLVRFLPDHGVDPNAVDRSKVPLLYRALDSGDIEIVSLLLEYGADIHVKDHVGRSILESCQLYRVPPQIVELLRQHGTTE